MPLFMIIEFLELYRYVKYSIVYTSDVLMYKKYNVHASAALLTTHDA